MKTYYAIGDKTFKVPVIVHNNSRFGECGLFKLCAPIHPGEITEEAKANNFNDCDTFKLFDSEAQAFNYASQEKFNQSAYGPNVFLVFEIQADENKLGQPIYKNDIHYIEASHDQIAVLSNSSVNLADVFGNTKPELLEAQTCRIF